MRATSQTRHLPYCGTTGRAPGYRRYVRASWLPPRARCPEGILVQVINCVLVIDQKYPGQEARTDSCRIRDVRPRRVCGPGAGTNDDAFES